MNIWFINDGFEDEDINYDSDKMPWEQGYDWDEINLFITFDEEEPYEGEDCILIGTYQDMLVDPGIYYTYGTKPNWNIWGGKFSQSFFKRAIEVVFNV